MTIHPKNLFFILIFFTILISDASAQLVNKGLGSLDKKDSWTTKDLMKPSQLASILNSSSAHKTVIFNIGVVENIKGSRKVGAASDPESLNSLKTALKKLPKTTPVVVYCGCCPFDKCPNIRPAFNMLKSMGFVNGKLLNLPVNLKQNWIDLGYPMAK